MGVLRFARWLFKKYPNCLVRLHGDRKTCDKIAKHGISPDWLELDLNAIFHPIAAEVFGYHQETKKSLMFSKAKTTNQTIPTEEDVCKAICQCIEDLRITTCPTMGIYMAIDSVAGSSKMSQQRKRRFKSAMEQGKNVGSWSSNKLTCGTEFMYKLSKYIARWVEQQLEENSAWENLKVILSDVTIYGEGEHACVKHMRANPERSFVVVSPDADLIFLLQSLHNPKTWIFRENIFDDIDADYVLLDIEKFGQCIIQELNYEGQDADQLKSTINDFISFAFFIGNDFLPSIPSISMHNDAVDNMLKLYPYVRDCYGPLTMPTPDGSFKLRKEGIIGLFSTLAESERDTILTIHKKSKARYPDNLLISHLKYEKANGEFKINFNWDEYRKAYYERNFHGVESKVICHEYIKGMLFVLKYYLHEIPSWTWSYPFSYAPLFTDLAKHAETFDFEYIFPESTPLSALEQLLAVMPPASAHLIPEALRDLLTSPTSPIIDMYPQRFKVDLDGKKQDYEGVILLPHVNLDRLRKVFREREEKLTEDEKVRNKRELFDVLFEKKHGKNPAEIYEKNV